MSRHPQPNDAQERIDQAAGNWLIRIEEEGLDQEATRDFDRWIASDPRNKSAYDAMRATWFDIAELPGLAGLAPTTTPAARPSISRAPGKWRWAAGLAVAASLVAGVAMFRAAPAEQHYRTDLAETRIVTLPDGSSVTLGARSSIAVAYQPAERRVILSSGQALFDVRHDARRPFVVDAGSSLIRDLGTKFDVNRTAGSVRVGVIEGRVRVIGTDGAAVAPVTVNGGEGVQILRVPAGASSPPGPIRVTTQQAAGAWRDGRLVFDNVRLADLSADVNRYYAPGVRMGSAAVGDLRVTAAFKTSEIPAFMTALDATLPVRTERMPDGGFRIVEARR